MRLYYWSVCLTRTSGLASPASSRGPSFVGAEPAPRHSCRDDAHHRDGCRDTDRHDEQTPSWARAKQRNDHCSDHQHQCGAAERRDRETSEREFAIALSHSESTQFFNSAAPASPDFSGWNWVADNGPFSTAARKSPPWSAQVSIGAAKTSDGSSSQRCAAYE